MNIYFEIETKDTKKTISLQQILETFFEERGEEDVLNVTAVLKRDEMTLEATVNADSQYPNICVDGTAGKKRFYLTNAEMPNPSYPHSFVSRLYAGSAEHETESPIAMVQCDIHEQDYAFRSNKKAEPMCKIVYIDTDLAVANPWVYSETGLPEHVQEAGEWIATDDDCCQYVRHVDYMHHVFELYQVCELMGLYKVAHAVIDVDNYSREETEAVLRTYGYKDTDDFIEQTSPEVIERKADGTLDEDSPYYIIDWQLIAEMFFEDEALSKHLIPEREWRDFESAANYIWDIVGSKESEEEETYV